MAGRWCRVGRRNHHDLRDQGYTVAINLVAGDRTALSRCSVTAIHNPDRSPDAVPMNSTTVYVDVSCPSDNHSGFGFRFRLLNPVGRRHMPDESEIGVICLRSPVHGA